MLVAHYRKTPVAWAPEAICGVINNYTNSRAYVVGYKTHRTLDGKTDLIHNHNMLSHWEFKAQLIQFHSEPFRTDWNVGMPKLVIPQWPAFFHEYAGANLARNPIDLYSSEFLPRFFQKKIRIGYSPSINHQKSLWHDKGYEETINILNGLKLRYPADIELDIIHGVSLNECLERKANCNIFIDEVKTGSYHRSGLESLAMGILTICSINKNVEELLFKVSGSNRNPFVNVNMSNLEEKLLELIDLGMDIISAVGLQSRIWMQKFWDPCTIAHEYLDIYEKCVGES